MKNITIREATLAELPIIQALNYGLFEHEQRYDRNLNMKWPYEDIGRNFLKRTIIDEHSICLVAVYENEIVGYVNGTFVPLDSTRPVKRIQLVNIFIKDGWREKYIGTKLANAFLAWAKEKDVNKIILIANALNENAISFYKKLGFEPHTIHFEKNVR